jgi:cobalt-zinc-cadmium efflux system membrane fusion protein
MKRENTTNGKQLVLFAIFLVMGATSGSYITAAHEGHAPLPTKGVEVDVKQGRITLSREAAQALSVQSVPLTERTLEVKALAYATLVTPWQQQYFVSSPLSGRIAALHVTTGSVVEAGALLAEISSPDLDALQLELRTAANSLDLSRRQRDRLEPLAADQAVPQRDYIEAITKYEQDKNALEIARSKLSHLGVSNEAIEQAMVRDSSPRPFVLPLVSPIGGNVNHADLAIGKVVIGSEHLFEINDLSRLWAKIGVLERDIARVKPGQAVELEFSAYPKEPVLATVIGPSVDVDPVTHVASVWAELTNPVGNSRFLPGMYGTAKITTSQPRKLLTAPASALLGAGAERYLLVEMEATAKLTEYRRRNVTVLAQNSSYVQIQADSLYPGDRVVNVGGQVLSSFFVLGSLRLSKEGIRNVGLKTERAVPHVIDEVVNLEGIVDLRPGSAATISSQMTGVLTRLHVDRGQKVTKGQIIAEVFGLPLLDTQLQMVRDSLDARLLEETLARYKSLGQTAAVATRRIWEVESAKDAAISRREASRQSLITMGMSKEEVDAVLRTGQAQSTLPVRSPIDGVIVRLNKVLGEGVSADEAIIEVHDLSQPWIRAFLPEKFAPKVGIGADARVRLLAEPDFLGTGKVVRSSAMLGEVNRTLSLWIEFTGPKPPVLQRNLLVRASAIIGAHDSVLAVPLSAIIKEQARSYVFVQQKDGLIDRKHVELGRSDDRFVEVKSGISEGDLVAVQGAAELQTTFASVR